MEFARSHLRRHWRFYASLALGAIVFALAFALRPPVRLLAGGDAAFATYIALMSVLSLRITPRELDRKADVEDEGIALIILIALAMIGFCSFAIFQVLENKKQLDATALVLALAGAPLGWFTLHVTMAFHYADLFYADPAGKGGGGLKFPDTKEPGAIDFLYYSFVVGMTAQVSDVQVTSPRIRRTTLGHSIVAFFFNTVLIAMAVNAVVALAG